MKKVFLTLVLIATPLLISAQTFDFAKDAKFEGWRYGGCEAQVAGGELTIEMKGSKTANIRRSRIKADSGQYMHVVLKNTSNIAKLSLNFKDAAEKKVFIHQDISTKDSEFKTYTFHAGSKSEWSGDQYPNIRLTPVKGEKCNGTLIIDKIIFNNEPSL